MYVNKILIHDKAVSLAVKENATIQYEDKRMRMQKFLISANSGFARSRAPR